MITTDDDGLAEKFRRIRSHGLINRDTHVNQRYDYQMSKLRATVGAKQVEQIPNSTQTAAGSPSDSRRNLGSKVDRTSKHARLRRTHLLLDTL